MKKEILEIGLEVAIISYYKSLNKHELNIGKVVQVNDLGIRLTLYSFVSSEYSYLDLFLKWEYVEKILICTPQDDHNQFIMIASNLSKELNCQNTF